MRRFYCETCGVGVGGLSRREARAERKAGHVLRRVGEASPSAAARGAAALERAAFYRWSAGKSWAAPQLAGNEPLSGVPWGRLAHGGPGRGHAGWPTPCGWEAAGVSRAMNLAAARYWLEQAALWRNRAALEAEEASVRARNRELAAFYGRPAVAAALGRWAREA
jgi:hypothetical protein